MMFGGANPIKPHAAPNESKELYLFKINQKLIKINQRVIKVCKN